MLVELIDTIEGLKSLEKVWRGLWEEDPSADIFSSFDWFMNWWEHFGNETDLATFVVHKGDDLVAIDGSKPRLNLLFVSDSNKTAGIVPLILIRGQWRHLPARLLLSPLNNHASRSGWLLSTHQHKALSAIVKYLVRSQSWDIIILDGIAHQSKFIHRFQDVSSKAGLYGYSDLPWSHSYISLEGGWERYIKGKSENFRRTLHRAEKALEKVGHISVRSYEGTDMADAGMKVFLEIDSESWKAEKGESIAVHQSLGAYYIDMARRFAKNNQYHLWSLDIQNEPAAAFLCLKNNHEVYTIKSSYKKKFASNNRSPSFVLLARILQEVSKTGFDGVDFFGKVSFTERWATHERKFDQFVLFRRGIYGCLGRLIYSNNGPLKSAKRIVSSFFMKCQMNK